MKHSAKAVAKLAREREELARHTHAATADAERADGVAPVVATGVTAVSDRGRAGYLLAQLPYALVLAGVLLGLVLMRGGVQAVRGGTLVIASALLAGSLTRLLLPDAMAGLLGSRRRLVDVGLLTALGVGLLIAGLIVKVPS